MSRRGQPVRSVFLGLTEIGGYYAGLGEGLRRLGIDVVHIDLTDRTFATAAPRSELPLVARLARQAALRNASIPGRRSPAKVWWKAASIAARLPLLAWAIARFDVFVFGYASTFLDFAELPLLRLLGKRIVYVFHGSDSRPPYLDGSLMAPDRNLTPADCVRLTGRTKSVVRRIERYADLVVSNPLSSQLHERRFASFGAIGVPRRVPATAGEPPEAPIRIAHAPSHPEAKGTREIREAVARLRAGGLDLELVEIVDRPNEDVLVAIASSHFVVDQLYSDVPMAALVAEAAGLGRPAVVGSYGIDEIRAATCGEPLPPVLLCPPEGIEEAIGRLASDSGLRHDLGARAKEFVDTVWSPRAVAGRLLLALERGDDGPWSVEPATCRYVYGLGLSRERAAALVRATVEEAGVAALCVEDKPELERELLAGAGLGAADRLAEEHAAARTHLPTAEDPDREESDHEPAADRELHS